VNRKFRWGVLIVRGAPVILGAIRAYRRSRLTDDKPRSSDPRSKGSPRFILAVGLLVGIVGGYLFAKRRQVIAMLRRQRASRNRLDSLSRDELYKRAQQQDLPGRSNMSKDELQAALTASAEVS